MATNFLSLRSSAAASLTAVNLTGSAITTSTITVSTLNLQSTMVSLGQSTNQTYNNFSNGSYLTWTTAKSAMTSANKTVQSANGLYQMLVANATSGLFLSSDSGITWSTLSGGLPTLTGSAYWSDGAISANGQYITLSIYGGSLWMSADYGRTFALTNQPTPDIWLPLNGSVADSMGLSVVTATGSPAYVTLNYPGYTAQAVNLLNTAGSTATRYIQGTWAGATNFTVSFWFNAQTNSSGTIFSSSSGQTQIYLFGNYLYYATMINGSFANAAGTSYVISSNTWYYVSATFLANGLCSLYVNNTLIGSATNTTALSAVSSYYLGCNASISSAFNGYVDDLRITNAVSTYVPIPLLQPNIWMPFENTAGDLGSHSLPPSATPTIYLPFEGNVTDSMGFTTVTASSPAPTYVAVNREGYTGQALRLTNTAGGTAAQYLKAPWTGSANFTVSFWFNAQTTAASANQCIWYAYNGYVGVLLTPSNTIIFYCPNGSGANVAAATSSAISLNTWYHVHAIFQSNGVCSLYVNGVVIGTYTNSGGVGTLTTTQFGVGVIDNGTSNAFNGIVDDLRIYNSAAPFVPVSNTTVTGSLSYVPGVVGLNAVNLVNTAGVTPTNYIRGAWTGSSAWTVSFWFNTQSSAPTTGNQYTLFASYNDTIIIFIRPSTIALYYYNGTSGFDGISSSFTPIVNTWYHLSYTHQLNGTCSMYINGALIGTFTSTIYGGVPTIFGIGTYVGQNNFAFNGYIDDFRIYNAAIPIHVLFPQNYRSLALSGTGQYALAAAASGWVVGSSDSSRTWSKQAVSVGTNAPNSSSLSLNHTGQYQLVATGPAAGNIMPQLTGLAASTWTQGGVNWTASANVEYYPAYRAFNNLNASAADKWETIGAYTGGSFSYGGTATTSIQTIGSVGGDWLQIQSSVPLVLTSYSIGANDLIGRSPKTYYIVGSNDGSTWYPIQYCNFATIPFTTTFTTTSYITVNLSGTQSITAGQTVSATTITYTFTTNAYMYFRMVTTHLFSEILINIGEWNMNFRNSVSYSSNYGSTWLNTSSTVSNESVALSASGQYALSTNSVVPLARLTFDNTNADAQGVLAAPTVVGTPGYSTSIKTVGTHSVQFANATVGGTPTVYLNYTLPAVLNKPSMLTMSFWMYPTGYASTGYVITLTNGTQLGPYFYFRSSVVGLTFNINGGANQYAEYAQAPPLNAWTHLAMTFTGSLLSFYMNGVLLGTMSSSGSLTLTNGGNITNLFVGTLVASTGAFAGNVDDVRIYTSALSAHEISALYNNPALTQTIAVSNSYLPITSYTKPILPGITANVVDAAVSQTGQYMVAVTSSTTNNVYYSTDYGTTFTALTIGTAAMVSCSISYDGSYLTVESATTVHTLNRNTRGFSVTVGNQAGLVNQAQNAIAIGNQAGKTNQSANSIVLNASGSALDAVAPGFYVAPIATTTGSSATSFGILGYGTDNQVTQTNLTVLSNGNVGINATNPMYKTQIVLGSNSDPGTSNIFALTTADSGAISQRLYMGLVDNGGSGSNSYSWISASRYGYAYNSLALQPVGGNIGIGITNPVYPLSVQGHIQALNTTNDVMGLFSPSYGNFIHIGAWNAQGSISKNIVMNYLGGNVGIGMSTPNAPLHVMGVATSGLSGNPPMSLINSSYSSVRWDIGPNTNGDLVIFYNNNGAWLNRNNPAAGWNLQSDLRLKDEIEPIANCLDKITALRPVSYRWKYNMDSPYKSFGLIAQEAKDVIPEMVNSLQDSTHGEIYGITYTTCIPILIGAVKELSSTIMELQAANAATSSQMADLQAENAQLKSQISSLFAWAQTQGFSGTF